MIHYVDVGVRSLCRLLWRLWSPVWKFDDAALDQTAVAFDNPDFVDVVIHSYRHRFGLVAGDPALEAIERQLAAQPDITVPTVTVDGSPTVFDRVAQPSTPLTSRGHSVVWDLRGHNVIRA
jgi:hypothetical protein